MKHEESKKIENLWIQAQKKLEDSINSYVKGKFRSGRKSSGTTYAQEAFGKYYPQEAYPYSLAIDSYTATMDDLYDDTKASNEERKMNVLATNSQVIKMLSWPEALRKEAILHAKKMSEIGIKEEIIAEQLKNTDDETLAIELSKECYFTRAKVMDFAVRIPCYFLSLPCEKVKIVEEAGRSFRALILLEKDIKDVEHDILHGTETPVTIFLKKGFDVDRLRSAISTYSLENLEKIVEVSNDKIVKYVAKNFYGMCKDIYRYV